MHERNATVPGQAFRTTSAFDRSEADRIVETHAVERRGPQKCADSVSEDRWQTARLPNERKRSGSASGLFVRGLETRKVKGTRQIPVPLSKRRSPLDILGHQETLRKNEQGDCGIIRSGYLLFVQKVRGHRTPKEGIAAGKNCQIHGTYKNLHDHDLHTKPPGREPGGRGDALLRALSIRS